MPVILNPEEQPDQREGAGWRALTLAGRRSLGEAAMAARRWSLEPGAAGPEIEHADGDEMLYVISGSGTALVGDRQLELLPESLLWLEPGDRCRLQAGPHGLDILQACAPAGQDGSNCV